MHTRGVTFDMHVSSSAHDRRVLRAYARRNKMVGYCQGLNFIAGFMRVI